MPKKGLKNFKCKISNTNHKYRSPNVKYKMKIKHNYRSPNDEIKIKPQIQVTHSPPRGTLDKNAASSASGCAALAKELSSR